MPVSTTTIPNDILGIISEFANIEIETKAYKRYKKETRIVKIKHKCDLCKVVRKNLITHYVAHLFPDYITKKWIEQNCYINDICSKCVKKFYRRDWLKCNLLNPNFQRKINEMEKYKDIKSLSENFWFNEKPYRVLYLSLYKPYEMWKNRYIKKEYVDNISFMK